MISNSSQKSSSIDKTWLYPFKISPTIHEYRQWSMFPLWAPKQKLVISRDRWHWWTISLAFINHQSSPNFMVTFLYGRHTHRNLTISHYNNIVCELEFSSKMYPFYTSMNCTELITNRSLHSAVFSCSLVEVSCMDIFVSQLQRLCWPL